MKRLRRNGGGSISVALEETQLTHLAVTVSRNTGRQAYAEMRSNYPRVHQGASFRSRDILKDCKDISFMGYTERRTALAEEVYSSQKNYARTNRETTHI